MCGITGICYFSGRGAVDKPMLKRMADTISYRGPDQEGSFIDTGIGLYHKRLSIIDLSISGKQPMGNKEGTVTIVFNGEIYNFKQLKEELEKKYTFFSDSDTEVILHGYEEYGEGIVKKLRGMFAFAIWDNQDKKNKKLFIARDRIGKKPLLYSYNKERFVFASELKALLEEKNIKKDINKEAISYYLSYGFIPAPLSIFNGIQKLLPGHTLTVHLGTKEANPAKKISIKQYWDLEFSPQQMSEKECCIKILKILNESTKLRMISDVPLGAFLSGGVDSSAVVALMARNSENPIKTFSIGFEEKKYNELEDAWLLADKYKTEHKEIIVHPEAIHILPKLVWLYNEPFADSSAIPSYYVSQATKEHVTAALNGDGGDESFAGYGRFFMDRYVDRYNHLPEQIRDVIRQVISQSPKGISTTNVFKRAKELSDLSGLSKNLRFIYLSSIMGLNEKDQLCRKESALGDVNVLHMFEDQMKKVEEDQLSRNLYAGIKTYLPNDLLVKMDIASMAHSLEARSPFLDHTLMEFAATIPSSIKMKGNVRKYILKKAVKQLLPPELLKKKKQGFSVPMNPWMRGELGELTDNVLQDARTVKRGYFHADKIKTMIQQHREKRADNGHKLWSLLCLEIWHRQYIDKQKPEFDIEKLV